MRRFILSLFVAFALVCGNALAGDGVIVSVDRGMMTVKVDDKEKKIETRGVKFLDADGKEVPRQDRRNLFKKDAKVEIVEKDGKVVEIKLKK
jgi:hypothetical protein